MRVLGTSPLGDFDEVGQRSLNLGPSTGLETAIGVDEQAIERERARMVSG